MYLNFMPSNASETQRGTASARKRGTSSLLLLGPAFVAAVAYVDPGNVAANLTAGAEYGYLLVWVLVAANLIAVLVQYLSSKLGLVSGQSLSGILGRRLGRRRRLAYWGQAEIVAIATDLAEVVGGAIALKILFDLPLLLGGVIVGIVSLVLLSIQSSRGQRPFEFVIIGFLAIIAIGFLAGLVVGDVDWGQAAGGLVPRLEGTNSLVLAASMLGATVMPHAIYLHSALSVDRHGGQPRTAIPRLLRASRWDVVASLVIAGSVNIAMLLLAAAACAVRAAPTRSRARTRSSQPTSARWSGSSSASDSSPRGSRRRRSAPMRGPRSCRRASRVDIPIVWRRAVTMIPALIVLAIGADPTWALVLSQVVLSLGIPFAMVPLVRLTANRSIMGEYANGRWITTAAVIASALIIALNVALLVLRSPSASSRPGALGRLWPRRRASRCAETDTSRRDRHF